MTFFAGRRLHRAEDLAWSLMLLTVLYGFSVGTSDDLAFLPWVSKWWDPQLYGGDLRFGAWPISYYVFHLSYLVAVTAVMPMHAAIVVSIIGCWTLLLYSLRDLAETLAGREVPALLFAVLLTGYCANYLAGGYYLLTAGFSTHAVAFSLSILAIARLLRGRVWQVFALVALAIFINPRVGLIGAVSLTTVWIWLRPEPWRAWLLAAFAVLGVAVCVVFAVMMPSSVGGMSFQAIARTWIFVRSTWHYAPSSWSPFVFIDLVLVATTFAVLLPWCTDKKVQAVWFAAASGFALVILGIINAYFMIVPALVLANPLEFGPIVLALFYVLLAIALVERFREGKIYSTLPALIVPDLQSRLVLLLINLVQGRTGTETKFRGKLVPGEERVLAAQAIFVLFSFGVLIFLLIVTGTLHRVEYIKEWLKFPLLSLSVALVISWCVPALGRYAVLVRFAVVAAVIGMQTLRSNANPVGDGVTEAERDICASVIEHTAKSTIVIIPPDRYAFEYYCQRASYFSYDQLPLNLDRHPLWIRRLKLLELIPPGLDLATLGHPIDVNYAAYGHFDAGRFKTLAAADPRIAYVIVHRPQTLQLPLVHENAEYRLYALSAPADAAKHP
jgi:hypothetical protein